MKKRLLCLLLGLAMILLPALTACSPSEDEEPESGSSAPVNATTLTMWVVCEEEVDPSVAEAINNKINALCRAKYKTELEISFLTEDVYEETLRAEIEAYIALKEQEEASKPEDEEETEAIQEVETNKDGLEQDKYPETMPHQVDIIYIAGEDMYLDFVKNGWLADLESELTNASKKIKEYISTTLLSAVEMDGATYAIPNNNIIGEYTYMLLNKELMDKYSQQGYFKQGKIDGLFNEYVYNYLAQIAFFEDPSKVVPIDGTYEDCLDFLAYYWNVDPDSYTMQELNDFSVFGYAYTNEEELTRGSVLLGYNSLFKNEIFTNNYLQLNAFRFGLVNKKATGFSSFFGDADASDKDAAIRFVTGDATTLQKHNVDASGKPLSYPYVTYDGEEYYSVVLKYPTATSDDIFGNMFGVCEYSRDVSRSMEIITYLNTNSEFRNLLQYGIEGDHYKLVKDENGNQTVQRLTDREGNEYYVMDIYKTGNIFIAYPESEMAPGIWESGKEQNRSSLVDPMLGFNLKDVALDAVEEEEAPSINSLLGYNLSYSTGYSKAALSSNAALKAWIEKCDAAGKNIYVLPTVVASGATRYYTYYVYNNMGTENANFSVVAGDPITEEIFDDDGAPTGEFKQIGANLTFQYTQDESKESYPYDLSIVTIQTRRNYELNLSCAIGDAVQSNAVFEELDDELVVDVDPYSHSDYEFELFANRSQAMFRYNKVLDTWRAASTEPKPYVLKYQTTEDGKTTYTFAILRNAPNMTDMSVVPYYEDGKLTVKFNFVDTGYLAEDAIDKYDMAYMRITVDEALPVDYIILADGVKENAVETVAEEDPDYRICGDLHVELIKYMAKLNEGITDLLMNCATYEDLEKLVADLQALLTSGGREPEITSFTSEALKEFIYELAGVADETVVNRKNTAAKNEIKTIRKYIGEALATEKPKTTNEDGDELLWTGNNKGEEPYVYYSSPNTLYHQWAEDNKYVPGEEEK